MSSAVTRTDGAGPEQWLDALRDAGTGGVTHVRTRPAREASLAEWPDAVAPAVRAAFEGKGIHHLWSHQRTALDAVFERRHVVVATGTASGKSLAYQVPMLTAAVDGADFARRPGDPPVSALAAIRGATTLYLSPTKALAADQRARLDALAIPGARIATLDGDTPPDERRWIRDHAGIILTNPDLLHHSMLPAHERWSIFWRSLRLVVIDECHVYRGVFGAHTAGVIRRLRRVAARYGSHPTFVLASATSGEPAAHARALTGLDVDAVTDDGSPSPALTFALWEPGPPPGAAEAMGEAVAAATDAMSDEDGDAARDGDAAQAAPGAAQDRGAAQEGGADDGLTVEDLGRRSAVAETADLFGELVGRGVQTLAFARSRVGVEVMADMARNRLWNHGFDPDLVAAYRGGYLPEERRTVECGLRDGTLAGVAATSALELGIDVSGLDAVLLAGWPGTVASLRQQSGRAGRSGRDALAVFVAADDPLDTYLVHHPDVFFDRPVEATVVDPSNPYVLGPQLASAAAELPLTAADEALFGADMWPLVEALVAQRVLRRRPSGWYWARDDRPGDHVSLRGDGGSDVRIVESRTGAVLGTVDGERAHSSVFPGAVYVHQGRTFVVTSLDLDDGSAHVVRGNPGWSTAARSVSSFDILEEDRSQTWGAVGVHYGTIRVRTQVTSFLRRLPSGEVIGEHPLDLPERTLMTKGVWWTVPEEHLLDAGVTPESAPGALHAAEHCSIGLISLVAQGDRWDVGGVSTALHPDTDMPTVVVYDALPGGSGFAERAYERAATWLRATQDAIVSCGCEHGCPACIQSPKCGNGNSPLDKAGALTLLECVLADAPDDDSRRLAGG